jgi:hypothetical protein
MRRRHRVGGAEHGADRARRLDEELEGRPLRGRRAPRQRVGPRGQARQRREQPAAALGRRGPGRRHRGRLAAPQRRDELRRARRLGCTFDHAVRVRGAARAVDPGRASPAQKSLA